MSAQLIECSSDSEWDEFVLRSEQGSVFALSAFLRAQAVASNRLLLEMDGKIVATALIIEPNISDFRAPSPYSLYQGIALLPLTGSEHSRVSQSLKIIEACSGALAERYRSFALCQSPAFTDLRGFQWFNYHTPQHGRYQLDLQYTGIINLAEYESHDHYLTTIRSSRRQDAKKAGRLNMKVEESADVAEFMRLYRLTFDRQDIEVDERSLLKVTRIVEESLNTGIGRLVLCRDAHGVACSAVVTLQDARCVYYMFGATDPEFRSTGAHTALLLDRIGDAREAGRMKFDMVGVNSPQRGDFKTSFNAKPVPFYSLSYER